MKWGRNDPCPCGSGKTHQECCFNRVADFQEYKWLRLAHELQEKLLGFAEEDRFVPESEAAFHLYWNLVAEELFEPAEEPAFVSFVDWFIHDYQLENMGSKTLIQVFLEEREPQLGPMETHLLQSWAASYITLLGVKSVGEHSLVMEDLLAGGQFTLQEGSLVEGLAPGVLLLGRLVRIGEDYQFSGAAMEFTPLLGQEIVQVVVDNFHHWQLHNPDGTWPVFLKEHGFRLATIIAQALEGEEPPEPGRTSQRDWSGTDSQQQLVQMLETYYRRWVDVAVPAFAGKTPREMARTAAGRREIEALLKDLEAMEKKKNPGTEASFDFNKLRVLLGMQPQEQGNHDPSYREVKRLLEEEHGENQNWLNLGQRIWHDFYSQAKPQVKKATAWAAAIIYTVARLVADHNVTQKELARRYQVAPGTISTHYRTIWDTLGLDQFDQHYTQ